METEYCYDCMKKDVHYKCGKAVWIYNHAMAQSIGRFKYQDKQEYAFFYGNEMARIYGTWIVKHQIEAFIPVPIHQHKRNHRGYNQAELIARVLSDNLGIPIFSKSLIRNKETRPQKDLTHSERMKNVGKAFACDVSELYGLEKVALVDDIYTTGSTIESCAKVLLNVGIKEVYFLCVSIGVSV